MFLFMNEMIFHIKNPKDSIKYCTKQILELIREVVKPQDT